MGSELNNNERNFLPVLYYERICTDGESNEFMVPYTVNYLFMVNCTALYCIGLYCAGSLTISCHGDTMDLHMVPHTGFPRKLFATSFTFEWFLTRVNSQMVVKVASMVELSSTGVTFKRTFTWRCREKQ